MGGGLLSMMRKTIPSVPFGRGQITGLKLFPARVRIRILSYASGRNFQMQYWGSICDIRSGVQVSPEEKHGEVLQNRWLNFQCK